jgi:class 3 adenylate cyclase
MMCGTALAADVSAEETRKVVTVLFADVKGSTEIGERLDPEAVRRVLTRFYASAREAVERHGGTVEKFIGDAVMAVFGVPRVREDDALRGVRAAWALLDVMRAINAELSGRYGAELLLRIGVNTGEVVAGDPSTQSSFVAGDAVNVAARLEQNAPPGEVYFGAETHQLVRHEVEAEPVEPLTLKGKSEPVPAFRLLGLRAEPGLAVPAPDLVGRKQELDALLDGLERATSSGRLDRLAIVGPAGVGKTRLLEETERRSVDRARAIRVRCAPEGDRARLATIQDLLRAALGPGADDPAETVAETVGASDRAPLLLDAVAETLETRDPAPERGVWAVAEMLRGAATHDPLVVSIDDAHWAEADLRGHLDDLMRRLADLPILWLETYRDDAAEAATPPTNVPVFQVGALDRPGAERLLDAVLRTAVGVTTVSTAVRERMLDAAGGNPLFLIEIGRLAAEGSLLSGEVAVPSSVRALIAARIDALPPDERRALEIAGVLGRRFTFGWLEDLFGDGVQPVVDGLTRKALLEPAGSERMAFPHGSLRDVAYASTTKQRRADLHEAAAGLCERDRAPLEVLGHHLQRAVELRAELGAPDDHDRELAERGARALATAGEEALSRADRGTASDFLGRATALVSAATERGASTLAAARLAFRLGAWEEVIALALPLRKRPETWNPLGVALAKRARGDDLEQGRQLLERAAGTGDADALASLAGTWKGVDDARALALYRNVLELDPSEPYALGNVLEYEIESSGDLSPVDEHRPALVAAVRRRQAQADRGEDRPWSWYDLGKYRLMLGAADESLSAYAAAVHTSGAGWMIATSLRSLDRITPAFGADGALGMARTLLGLGLAALFPQEAGSEVRGDGSLPAPVWILAGSSGGGAVDRLAGYEATLVTAFEGLTGTIVSGGTAQGVGSLAGDVSGAVPGIRAIGYVPSRLPRGVELDRRYDEIRRTEGERFSPLEPLRYWSDILASGAAPAEVRMLGLRGGAIARLEYELALALGARVGLLSGGGGSSLDLLRDPTWATSDRLVEVSPSVEAVRVFLTT